VHKLGLKGAYHSKDEVKEVVWCILALSLLPATDICTALQDIRAIISSDVRMVRQLQKLVAYMK